MIMSPFLDESRNRAYSKRKRVIAGIQRNVNFYMLFWKSQTNCYRLWGTDLRVSKRNFYASRQMRAGMRRSFDLGPHPPS